MAPVLCTQPRRFAVVAVAKMVAKARNCELGEEIGYHIGHSKLLSSRYFVGNELIMHLCVLANTLLQIFTIDLARGFFFGKGKEGLSLNLSQPRGHKIYYKTYCYS